MYCIYAIYLDIQYSMYIVSIYTIYSIYYSIYNSTTVFIYTSILYILCYYIGFCEEFMCILD